MTEIEGRKTLQLDLERRLHIGWSSGYCLEVIMHSIDV